jgi:hypothetical protein
MAIYGPSTFTREKVTFGAVDDPLAVVPDAPETAGAAGVAVAAGAGEAGGAAEGDAAGV